MTLDALAKRYGKLPTEILSLPLDDLAINGIVFGTAAKYEASVQNRRPMKLSRGSEGESALQIKLDGVFEQINSQIKRSR